MELAGDVDDPDGEPLVLPADIGHEPRSQPPEGPVGSDAYVAGAECRAPQVYRANTGTSHHKVGNER